MSRSFGGVVFALSINATCDSRSSVVQHWFQSVIVLRSAAVPTLLGFQTDTHARSHRRKVTVFTGQTFP